MKNNFRILVFIGILTTIGLLACDNGTTSNDGGAGAITIIDIPAEYNGKYIHLSIVEGNDTRIVGARFIQPEGTVRPTFYAVQISNNKAILPLYFYDQSGQRYTGNDTFTGGEPWPGVEPQPGFEQWSRVMIRGRIQTGNQASWYDSNEALEVFFFSSITFKDGNATKSFKDKI